MLLRRLLLGCLFVSCVATLHGNARAQLLTPCSCAPTSPTLSIFNDPCATVYYSHTYSTFGACPKDSQGNCEAPNQPCRFYLSISILPADNAPACCSNTVLKLEKELCTLEKVNGVWTIVNCATNIENWPYPLQDPTNPGNPWSFVYEMSCYAHHHFTYFIENNCAGSPHDLLEVRLQCGWCVK